MIFRPGGAQLIIPGVEVWQAQGGAGGAFVGAYDAIPNIAALYSSRRALSSWTGNLWRLLRNSDDAQMDFGYVANGDLDTVAIASWLGGSSGLIHTEYDQSGNGYHVTQTTKANMPLYVASGQNGKPVARFDGDDALSNALLSPTQPHTYLTAWTPAASNSRAIDGINNRGNLGVWDANEYVFYSGSVLLFGDTTYAGAQVLVSLHSGTNSTLHKNGSSLSKTSGTTSGTGAASGIVLQSAKDQYEVIIANAAWNTTDRQAAEAAANQYWAIY